jgi:hypothetical protein
MMLTGCHRQRSGEVQTGMVEEVVPWIPPGVARRTLRLAGRVE